MSTTGDQTEIAQLAETKRHEALDDIKRTVAERQQNQGTTDSDLLHPKPPASNPGSDDPTGGIAIGHGGLSSTAAINGPKDAAQEIGIPTSSDLSGENTAVGGLIDKFKSVLGLGGESGASTNSDTATDEAVTTNNSTSSSKPFTSSAYEYVAGAAAGLAGGAAATAAHIQERVGGTGESTTATSSSHPTAASTSTQDDNARGPSTALWTSSTPVTARAQEIIDTTATKVTEAVTPDNNNNTTTAADTNKDVTMSDRDPVSDTTGRTEPTNENIAATGTDATTSGEGTTTGEKKDLLPTGEGPNHGNEDHKPRATLDNPDSIPTAGGERLGEKHWGESKVVPDLPPKTEEAGTSSTDGQPNDETAANTAKNAGGPHDKHEHDSSKQGFMDKIKDKLHHEK